MAVFELHRALCCYSARSPAFLADQRRLFQDRWGEVCMVMQAA